MSDTKELQRIVDALETADGNKAEAARLVNLPPSTYKDKLKEAENIGLRAAVLSTKAQAEVELLKRRHRDELKVIKAQLETARKESMDSAAVRKYIYGLADYVPTNVDWSKISSKTSSGPGIPTLAVSDLHWGEVVDPDAVGGVNSFNLAIAHKRLKKLTSNSLDLAKNHMVSPSNEVGVIWLGGDMISGKIHAELNETNELPIIPTIHHLYERLIALIQAWAETFGKLYIVYSYGNHGRDTLKPTHKSAAYLSWDWHLYQMLEKHFKAIKANHVHFVYTTSPDTLFPIYSTQYLFTHGDRMGVAGGDGVIGAIGPITRGTKKIITHYANLGRHVDYVVMGHWHQALWLPFTIVNNTLKGFDEFSMTHRFECTPPSQLMWWTHPKYGITFRAEVWVDDRPSAVV